METKALTPAQLAILSERHAFDCYMSEWAGQGINPANRCIVAKRGDNKVVMVGDTVVITVAPDSNHDMVEGALRVLGIVTEVESQPRTASAMFVSHNPPHQDNDFARDMRVVQQSRPQWVAYVTKELVNNAAFLNAAWHGDARLEGQDGTIYSMIAPLGLSMDSPALTLWEARWTKAVYTGAGTIPLNESHLFTVKLPASV
jgi:hypothetical protein